LISLYSGLGIGVMIICHANASIYQKEYGSITYSFPYSLGILLSIVWIIIITFLVFVILLLTKKRHITMIIGVPLLVMTIGIIAFRFINGGLNIYNISYLLFEVLILFLILHINNKFKNQKKLKIKSDVLKLEHKEILEYIHLLAYVALIFFIYAVISVFYENLSFSKEFPQALPLMVYNHLFLYLYFIFGYSFGIIGQLLTRLSDIKKQLS
jgi:hypothetical protein